MTILQPCDKQASVQSAQPVKGAERLEPCFGIWTMEQKVFEAWCCGLISRGNEQALDGIALPTIRTFHGRRQILRVQLIQSRDGPQRRVRWVDAINTPHLRPGAEIDAFLKVFRYPFRMLDDQPVHVGHIKRAIRTGLCHRRAKPIIARGQEFRIRFIGGAMAGEGNAGRLHDLTMNQVMNRLADEITGGEAWAKEIIAVWGGAVGRSQMIRAKGIVEALRQAADRKDAAKLRVVGDDLMSDRNSEGRVARKR